MSMDEATAGVLLAEAERRKRGGRLSVACALYQQILDAWPDHVAALAGLSSALLMTARPAEAEPLLARLVALQPRHPGYYMMQGQSLQALGRIPEAARAFLQAVDASPSTVDSTIALVDCLITLGQAADGEKAARFALSRGADPARATFALGRCQASGQKWADAEASFSSILALEPEPETVVITTSLLARAQVRKQQGHLVAALSDSQKAFDLLPEHDREQRRVALLLQATILRAQEAFAAAEQMCRKALEETPQSIDALAALGTMVDLQGRHSEAEALMREAAAREPRRTDVLYNLAGCLMSQARPAEAEAFYRVCWQLRPQWGDAAANLGVSLLAQARPAEAATALAEAVRLDEQQLGRDHEVTAEARYNLAWAQLIQGDFENGWQNYEARWQMSSFSSPARPFPVPRWDGTAQPQATLLVHAEQGLGDTIQFMRLLALVRPLVGKIILEVPPALVRLCQGFPHASLVVAANYAQPGQLPCPCDCHVPLMSLPALLNLRVEDIPAEVPYLFAPEQTRPELVLPPLPRDARKRVGVVWAGSASNKIDRFRSIPFPRILPFLNSLPMADVWSLQMMSAEALAAEAEGEKKARQKLPERMSVVQDMADTASLIAAMDLVIGVDTAVVHLAAAMGKPAWMLLPFAPDYRWFLPGTGAGSGSGGGAGSGAGSSRESHSPWYPTLRLFRQPSAGDWPAVLLSVTRAWYREMPGGEG